MRQILDLSHWNNVTNWCDVKKCCDGIILKCGGNENGKTYKDKKFEEYYEQCKKHEIPVGAYFFANGSSAIKGIDDATRVYELLKNKKFEYPIYIDYEVGDKARRMDNTMYVLSLVNRLEEYGYWVGVYGSDINTFKEMLDISYIKDKALWVARYGNKPQYVKDFQMWQHTSKGIVKGIDGHVDISECYANYPLYIKERGKNGYDK